MKLKLLTVLLVTIPIIASSQYQVPEYVQNFNDSLPTVYSGDLGGGYQEKADSTAKADLDEAKRALGMMVTYQNPAGLWITERYEGISTLDAQWLQDSNWVNIKSGSDSIYISGQDEWIEKNDTVFKVDTSNYSVNSDTSNYSINSDTTGYLNSDTLIITYVEADNMVVNDTATINHLIMNGNIVQNVGDTIECGLIYGPFGRITVMRVTALASINGSSFTIGDVAEVEDYIKVDDIRTNDSSHISVKSPIEFDYNAEFKDTTKINIIQSNNYTEDLDYIIEPPHAIIQLYDSSLTVAVTQNLWYQFTNAGDSLFRVIDTHLFTIFGDTIINQVFGDYMFNAAYALEVGASAAGNVRIMTNDGVLMQMPIETGVGGTMDKAPIGGYWKDVDVGDKLWMEFQNTKNGDDYDIVAAYINIWYLHP